MITSWNSVQTVLGLPDAKKDQVEALIPMIEAHYLHIRNKPFDTNEAEATVYPTGAELTAIEMIDFQLKRQGNISSESLGDYSVSYAGEGDYPHSIRKQIKTYVGFV